MTCGYHSISHRTVYSHSLLSVAEADDYESCIQWLGCGEYVWFDVIKKSKIKLNSWPTALSFAIHGHKLESQESCVDKKCK